MLIQYAQPSLVVTVPEEQEFIERFAKAVGKIPLDIIAKMFEDSIQHVERNANTSLLLSSISIKIAGIIGRKR